METNQRRKLSVDMMDLTFIGTSSGAPSMSRNQQALALQLCGQTWLFDCGEATQHRLMHTTLSPTQISRIFISHLHGDHVFGLPGLLCNIAAVDNSDGEAYADSSKWSGAAPVVLVGPVGLRSWLRTVLGNSYATLGGMKLQILELDGLRALEKSRMRPPVEVDRPLPNEVEGAVLQPNGDGSWDVPMAVGEPPVTVKAVELDHTVPTVGWVVTENPRAGKIDAARVRPLLAAQGVHVSAMRELKDGKPLTLPDGSVLDPADFVSPMTQRKLAILSDMRGSMGGAGSPPAAEVHAADASLLVHEATNACLRADFQKTGKGPREVEQHAVRHGHSTPQMAGGFAQRVGAQHLALTHFSPRYLGDDSHYARNAMKEFRGLARTKYAGPVTTAVDLMRMRVNINGSVDIFPPINEGQPGGRYQPAAQQRTSPGTHPNQQ